MSFHIGIDLGTSGCRACAIDDGGAEVAVSRAPLPSPMRQHPESEQQPDLWWDAVTSVLDALLAQLAREQVRSLAVDGTSATVLVTDAAGAPMAPALMYDDSRARDEAAVVAATAPLDSPARGAGSSLAKALYLHHRHREAAHILHQADWVTGRLCGQLGVSDENNCLKLGFDPQAREWPAWLQGLGLPQALFPRVVSPGTAIGPIAADVTSRFGLPSGVQVVAGTTDSTAAFLATGACQPGEAVTSLGSTLVLKLISPRPVFAPAYGVYSHRVGDLWLAGGASNSGGAVLAQYFSVDELNDLSTRLDPDQDSGLDYYPLPHAGERFPVNDPDLAPRLEPRPDDRRRFLHGLLEGIARIETRGYRLLQELGAPYPTSVRSVGGGAANPVWCRLRERLLGVPLIQPAHSEAAYGAALLARAGVLRLPLLG